MTVTKSVSKLTDIASCAKLITIEAYASPLLNVNHSMRVSLTLEGRECGTTMPAILFAGMKLKVMSNASVTSENDMLSLSKVVVKNLRHLLTEIHLMEFDDDNSDAPIALAKTFQEKVFRHIVWGESLIISGEQDLIRNTKKNRAHTVTMLKTPTFTIPSYLCKWALEKDGLSENNKYSEMNPYLRRVAFDVYDSLKGLPVATWKEHVSFSRKIQNIMLISAFKTSMKKSEIAALLFNPGS